MTFYCTQCGAGQDVSPGSRVTCPACAKEWVVPGPAATSHPPAQGMSKGTVVAVVVGVAGFGFVLLMFVLAAIAIPSFNKFGARSKQGEARSNLKGAYVSEKGLFQEDSKYSVQVRKVGFAPERGNRYAYFFDVHGPMEDRSKQQAVSTEDDTAIGADTFRHVNRPITVEDLPASVRDVGLKGTCPECNVTIVAAGRITTSDQLDVWSISTAPREIGGQHVAAGEPYHDVDGL